MPVGVRRAELLRKARHIDVAGEINRWLTSPDYRRHLKLGSRSRDELLHSTKRPTYTGILQSPSRAGKPPPALYLSGRRFCSQGPNDLISCGCPTTGQGPVIGAGG
ncbi:hypothetical protein WN72_36745 [Bradyrhizobium arachidis]|uniref:Uncharacterized protein n=1 Tax=Bradyrhizobium arachidis TaxID=858423 RepID=A0AAE7NVN7_9BRAD|nr:hypothetical protein WN72_36745 [Bradyrhizobium arachidis]